LSDAITTISPTRTPLQMLAGKGKATGKTHEWQTDALAAAVTTNAQLEGDVIVGTASTPTVRLANYCQISTKDWVVTGTQESVKKAGRVSEKSYQKAKRLRNEARH
jgi:malonyl CoA-acyl carrier protein transacylase